MQVASFVLTLICDPHADPNRRLASRLTELSFRRVLYSMIRRNGLPRRKERSCASLVGIAAIAIVNVAHAASLDAAGTLDLITKTADGICNVVSTKGEAESSEVKGEVKAQLSGLAAKLADAGISGSGIIKSDRYQNVLRQDLASTLHDNASCKLKVFGALQAKLLSPPAPSKQFRRQHEEGHGPSQSSIGDYSPNIYNSHNIRIGQ
jgi:hypothetical protein